MIYYTNKDFNAGYDAAALGLDFDTNKNRDWRNGWLAYHNDMDRSESMKFV